MVQSQEVEGGIGCIGSQEDFLTLLYVYTSTLMFMFFFLFPSFDWYYWNGYVCAFGLATTAVGLVSLTKDGCMS